MTSISRQQLTVTDHDGTALRVGSTLPRPMFDGARRRANAAAVGALAIACASVLAGCAAVPGADARPQMAPLSDYATTQSFAAPVGEWPNDAWWTGYHDPQLNELIAEALAGSPTLAIAHARLQQANAMAAISEGALAPQINANASATEQKQSYNYLSPRAVTPEGWNDIGYAALTFSWQLDFWGRNRAALAAATSDANAMRADVAQARLTLAAAVASAYAELARTHAARDTAAAALEVRSKTADLFRRRHETGLETLGSVRQLDARRESAAADLLALDEQLALQRNELAALVGAGPDRGLSITRPTLALTHGFTLPESIGTELLGRRPDIRAARMRAEAASKRIDQSRAAFYPNVNLTALIGAQSLGLDMLTREGSSTGNVGPAISLPIFNAGQLRNQYRRSEAEYAQAVAEYHRAIIQALQEVADAATSQKALGPQLERIDDAVAAAREAWRIQNNRYEGGLATYLDVLTAEDSLLANLRQQSDLQSRSLSLDIALTRALGGGYSNQTL
jgi:NodT family efflux transporter outer membrane factor (OMF) lipoprotein